MNETRPDPSDDRILELDRVFYASRARVFAAWTEPDLIARWWGPGGFDTPLDRVTVELRPGGRFEKVMVLNDFEIATGMKVPPGTEFPDRSTVVEVVPPELLVVASEAQPDLGLAHRTVTRVAFHDEGDGTTRVTLTDGPYEEAMRSNAEVGWLQSFDKLATLVEEV